MHSGSQGNPEWLRQETEYCDIWEYMPCYCDNCDGKEDCEVCREYEFLNSLNVGNKEKFEESFGNSMEYVSKNEYENYIKNNYFYARDYFANYDLKKSGKALGLSNSKVMHIKYQLEIMARLNQ